MGKLSVNSRTGFKEKISVIFAKSFNRTCRGRLSRRPEVIRNDFPINLSFPPNAHFFRTGRTRRRGTGFTSRPRGAGTLRRTVRSSFPHRATARWGPQCGPPIELRFRLPKRLRLRREFEFRAASLGGPSRHCPWKQKNRTVFSSYPALFVVLFSIRQKMEGSL